ncbi:MAG: 3-oxoadipate enol-lactonase [Pseudomonadota bacterium]
MQFVSVDGVVLHARRSGDGGAVPLLLVHALGTDLRLWGRLLGYLGDGFNAIRYDQRGHGLSGIGQPPYTIDQLARDLAGLMDRLDTGPALVCGVSIGGQVALGLSAARPDLVRGLVLMDTAAQIGSPDLWQERIAVVEHDGVEGLATATMQRWFPPSFHDRHPADVEGMRAMLTRTPVSGYLGACAALAEADLRAAAAAVQVPTLCLVGEHDGSTTPAVVQALAETIPGAGFTVIAEAGHLPCIDQPAAVAAAVLGFVEANGLA